MGVPTWLEAAADVGTVAAGLALPLAFVQLGGLRRDRLRGQVDKVAAWPEEPAPLKSDGPWRSLVVGAAAGAQQQ
jgi:hypothetical protein